MNKKQLNEQMESELKINKTRYRNKGYIISVMELCGTSETELRKRLMTLNNGKQRCEVCGVTYTKHSKEVHIKSKKHIKELENKKSLLRKMMELRIAQENRFVQSE